MGDVERHLGGELASVFDGFAPAVVDDVEGGGVFHLLEPHFGVVAVHVAAVAVVGERLVVVLHGGVAGILHAKGPEVLLLAYVAVVAGSFITPWAHHRQAVVLVHVLKQHEVVVAGGRVIAVIAFYIVVEVTLPVVAVVLGRA